MFQCKKCEKKEFSAFFNQGLCKQCKEKIVQYQFEMPQYMKTVNEEWKKLKQLKDPVLFFTVYESLYKHLQYLIEYESYAQFKEKLPSELSKKLDSEIHTLTNEMLHDYYEITQSKISCGADRTKETENFYNQLRPYYQKMNTVNQNTIERMMQILKKA